LEIVRAIDRARLVSEATDIEIFAGNFCEFAAELVDQKKPSHTYALSRCEGKRACHNG